MTLRGKRFERREVQKPSQLGDKLSMSDNVQSEQGPGKLVRPSRRKRASVSLGKRDSEKRGAGPWAPENRVVLLQDSAKVCALLHRQRTLLQDLQEIR